MAHHHHRQHLEVVMSKDLQAFEADTRQRPMWERIQQNPAKVVLLVGLVVRCIVTMWSSAARLVVEDNRIDTFAVAGLQIVAYLFLGIYFADLITGLGHLIFDYVKPDAVPEKSRPFIQWVAYGFQYHHVVPTSWNDGDFFYLGILRTGMTVFTPLALLQQLTVATPGLSICLGSMALAGLFCQLPHAAAHGRWRHTRWSSMISFLQKCGLLLSPSSHHEHHSQFDCNFAILTGWSQPVLNAFYKHVWQHVVADDMSAETQRHVYVENRGELKRPYLQMFPDWREVSKAVEGDKQ